MNMLTMGVVRGISYGLFARPDAFGPALERLNAGLVRAYVYWGQVEPEPGRYDWTVVDALLDQVPGESRLWLTMCSSSAWATRRSTTFLPPSPPLDPGAYARFVTALVDRCGPRVAYWQCENEPSNAGLLWDGTAQEYADLLATFASAVRAAPTAGAVVLGGIGYDALGSEPGSDSWAFFETVCRAAASSFDLVDVHSYDDPRRLAGHLGAVRALLERCGCTRPLVVGEYGGPTMFGFPAAERAVQAAMMTAFQEGASVETVSAAAGETPDRAAMRALYEHLDDLPADLQQFLDGCPPAVAARRDRIACREVVTRNLLAFAEGVRVTCYWDLAPEVPGYSDRYNMLGLISARLALLDFRDGELVEAQPSAATFRMLTRALDGATGVAPITAGVPEGVRAYVVRFGDQPERVLHVLWRDSDPFDGDAAAPEELAWRWPSPELHAMDAFAKAVPVPVAAGRLVVPLSATPILLSTERWLADPA
jgi:hypothetical protein